MKTIMLLKDNLELLSDSFWSLMLIASQEDSKEINKSYADIKVQLERTTRAIIDAIDNVKNTTVKE